jgi:Tfp pilus assembly protein PilX
MNNINSKKGAVLPFAMIIIAFVSAITLSAYQMTEEQSIVSVESSLRDITFQAAESAIQEVIEDYSLSTQTGLETLNSVENEPIIRCPKKSGTVILEDGEASCLDILSYNSDEVVMQSSTERVNSLCLTWGNSDKSIKCYQIEGRGQLVTGNAITENVQEIQIIQIKQEDNGIYEF